MGLRTMMERRLLEDEKVLLTNDITCLDKIIRTSEHTEPQCNCSKCFDLHLQHTKMVRLNTVTLLLGDCYD